MRWLLFQSVCRPHRVVGHHSSRIQVDADQSPMTFIVHGDPHLCAQPVVSHFERCSAIPVRGYTTLHPAALMSSRTELHSTNASAVPNPANCGKNNDAVAPATHHCVQIGADIIVGSSLVLHLTEHCRSHCTDCVVCVLSVTSTVVSKLVLVPGMGGRPTLSVNGESMAAKNRLSLSSVTRIPMDSAMLPNSSGCRSDLCVR